MIVFPSTAFCFGIGANASMRYGRYYWSIKESFKLRDSAVRLTRKRASCAAVSAGGGILWETDPTGYAIAGFRQSVNVESFSSDCLSLLQVSIQNVCAFRIYRNDHFRLWLGPRLDINCRWGRDRGRSWYLAIPGEVPITFRRSYLIGTIGAGFSIGLNIPVGQSLLFSLETGPVAGFTASASTRDIAPAFSRTSWIEGIIAAGVMFRIDLPKSRKPGIIIIE